MTVNWRTFILVFFPERQQNTLLSMNLSTPHGELLISKLPLNIDSPYFKTGKYKINIVFLIGTVESLICISYKIKHMVNKV